MLTGELDDLDQKVRYELTMKYAALLFLLPLPLAASPWVLPEGQLVVVGRYDYETAREEFLDDGDSLVYSLNGKLVSTTYTVDVRLGTLENFELELVLPLKQVTYTADPVILLDDGGVMPAIDFYQENVLDFSQASTGLGDVELLGRYQLFRRALVGAAELSLKTPTGYEKPAGTFGRKPRNQEEFLAGVGTFVRPDNVADDVTLGDGVLDIGAGLLLGWALPTGTFTRLDTGYRVRFGGASHLAYGRFRVGQLLLGRLLVFGGADGELSTTDGDVIGVSVAAVDPALPAREYGGLNNLKLREVRLERDRLAASAGAILRLTDVIEVNGAYTHVLWGRNTSASRVISLGVGVRTDLGQ